VTIGGNCRAPTARSGPVSESRTWFGEAEVGAGDVAQGPVAGAIGNTVADAAGVRVRDLPVTRDLVVQAKEER
jgi:CO/xanthine dehydrogenase Mo-binding subunit